jgi:hypothetical protein
MPSRKKKSGNIYVGLDPSLTGFGLAVYRPLSGVFSVTTLTSKPALGIYERMWRFDKLLGDVIDAIPDETVGIGVEGYSFASKGGLAFDRVEFGGILRHRIVCDLQIAPVEVPPTALKKFVLGKGRGKGVDKAAQRIAAFKRWGIEFDDDNQCDAYVLARIAACIGGDEEPETDAQRAALVNLGWAE